MNKTVLEQIADHKTKQGCSDCGRSFGLIRHRHYHKQFCSHGCLENYLARKETAVFPASSKQLQTA
jgi:hypothetical protein